MAITFSTVVNLVLFNGAVILLLHFIISKSGILLFRGIRFFYLLVIFVLLRLFLPIELPTQNNIHLTEIWPSVHGAFTRTIFNFAGKEWSLQALLTVISIAVSVTLTAKLFILYYLTKRKFRNIEPVSNAFVGEMVAAINTRYKKTVSFRIVRDEKIMAPLMFGLWKPYIVLPAFDLTKDEWYYVLNHEMAHFYYKDLWVRFLCELLQALCWWNPFIYIFRKQIAKIQEFRVDSAITDKLNDADKLAYMECLIKVAKQQISNHRKWVATFSSGRENEVCRRIELIHKNMEPKGKYPIKYGVLILLFCLIIVFLPNFFIIEPYGISEKVKAETFTINEKNAYYILNQDGTYDFYLNGQYGATVETIFDENIPIYQSTEEELKND